MDLYPQPVDFEVQENSDSDEEVDFVEVALDMLTGTITDYGTQVKSMNAQDVNTQLMELANRASLTEKPKQSAERLAKIALLLKARLDQEVRLSEDLGKCLEIEKGARQTDLLQHAAGREADQAEIKRLRDQVQMLANEREQSTQQKEHVELMYAAVLQDADQTQKQLQERTQELTSIKQELEREKQQYKMATENLHKDIKIYSEMMKSTMELIRTLSQNQNVTGPPPPQPGGINQGQYIIPDPIPQPGQGPAYSSSLLGQGVPISGNNFQNQNPPSVIELGKIAKMIRRFEPGPKGSHETRAYLEDIEFFLTDFPNATVDSKIRLIKLTSSRKVSNFIQRQPDAIKLDYSRLCAAVEEEYAAPSGIPAAIKVMQGKKEHPLVYYDRICQAYFGYRVEPDMEEETEFKYFFIRNLNNETKPMVSIVAPYARSSIEQIKCCAVTVFESHKES